MRLLLEPKVYDALVASVSDGGKWDLLSKGEVNREPFCELCKVVKGGYGCVDCPVRFFTGASNCESFDEYQDWCYREDSCGITSTPAKRCAVDVRNALRGMLEFCVSEEDIVDE